MRLRSYISQKNPKTETGSSLHIYRHKGKSQSSQENHRADIEEAKEAALIPTAKTVLASSYPSNIILEHDFQRELETDREGLRGTDG